MAHVGRRRNRWLIAAGVGAGVLVAVVGWLAHAPASACEQHIRAGAWQRGVDTCLESYRRSGRDRELIWAARGYLSLSDVDAAEPLARRLLDGPLRGDAHAILSYIALRRGSPGAARAHALTAWLLHVLSDEQRSQATDAVAFAQAAWMAGDFAASLAAADEALVVARRLDYAVQEVAAQLARADALRRMGDLSTATVALRGAIARASAPCDLAWARLKLGLCAMDADQAGPALSELAAASEANARCGSADISTAIALNRAELMRRRDPAAAIATLDEVERGAGELVEVLMQRARLAADRGALDEAEAYLVRAEHAEVPDGDWPWEIAVARAELAELRGGALDELLAEHAYRRAVAMVTGLRATARARSAYLVASHRAPYDGLIGLLARQGRWRDALGVVLALDASDMLRATLDAHIAREPAAPEVEAAAPASAPAASVDAVLAAWRYRELVIAMAPAERRIGGGGERAYRLRLAGGEVTGAIVGDARSVRAWAAALFANPGNAEAALALGQVIVPRGSAGSSDTLHVLALGVLGVVPLAALRDRDGALILGSRPTARVLGLLGHGPESRATGAAVVIADPQRDLPSAATEGAAVAEVVGRDARVYGSHGVGSATRSRLREARDATLLHVAAHVGERDRWRQLHLADGSVGPDDIVQWRVAPRLAVLASCGSAAALDQEGWGSLAAAFLEAGTAVVIATDRNIDDAAAWALMRDFYAEPDWRADPVRVLARVQLRHASVGDGVQRGPTWAAFSALVRPPADDAREHGSSSALDLDPPRR